uniref:peptidylprolyl isomerase n=1 Tax=Jutongia sp. TaxID=2944204 RepID=UPI003078FF17
LLEIFRRSFCEKELQELYKKAADAKDFSKLLKDDSKSDIKFSDTSFTEKDGWSMVTDKKLLKQIKSMKKDEISDIIKDEKSGYVLFVKMVDNNSNDSYKKACDSAITSAKNDAYDTWYQGILENYKVSTNSDVWDDVTIGSVTTDIVTAADLEKMNGDSSDATSGK